MYIRAGDVGTLFPAYQAGKDGLPCITKKARRRPGVWVGGGTHQSLTTLFPAQLGDVVRQRGSGVSWVDWGRWSCLKYVTFLDVHDRRIPCGATWSCSSS